MNGNRWDAHHWLECECVRLVIKPKPKPKPKFSSSRAFFSISMRRNNETIIENDWTLSIIIMRKLKPVETLPYCHSISSQPFFLLSFIVSIDSLLNVCIFRKKINQAKHIYNENKCTHETFVCELINHLWALS